MVQIDKHAPGSFCGIELGTTDQEAAKAFYTKLFGWTVQDFPMGPNSFYSMFSLDSRNTGATYTLNPEQTGEGVPPHWMLYIATESADHTAQTAGQSGGR